MGFLQNKEIAAEVKDISVIQNGNIGANHFSGPKVPWSKSGQLIQRYDHHADG
jgi:hypothetical protein